MRPFKYLEPRNLDEACSLLSEHREEAKILAGGQSLVHLLSHRLISPQYIINIKGLPELEYIEPDRDGIRIGALTTHRAVETSPLIKERFPILAEMEGVLGSVQVRNWGTIGGDLCEADPGADPGTVLIALGAKVKARSVRGQREIGLEEFFVDYLETALESDEILEEIWVPYLPPHTGGIYIKESVRFGDFAFVAVAAVVTLDKEIIKDARITMAAVGSTPVRARGAERAIIGKGVGEPLEAAGVMAASEARPQSDALGSAEYKREMVRIVTNSAVSEAIKRAQTK